MISPLMAPCSAGTGYSWVPVAGKKDCAVPVSNARLRYRSDPALVRAGLAGRPEAWRELIDRYGRLVHSIPRRYGWSEADADDVFQIVFAILYRKLDTIRDQRQLIFVADQHDASRVLPDRQANPALRAARPDGAGHRGAIG